MVSGCCCKEVYRFPHNITYPSTCISPNILQLHRPSLFIFVYNILCNIANVAQRTFDIVQKWRSRGHGTIIILTRTSNTRIRYPRLQVRGSDNGIVEVSLPNV